MAPSWRWPGIVLAPAPRISPEVYPYKEKDRSERIALVFEEIHDHPLEDLKDQFSLVHSSRPTHKPVSNVS